MISLKGKTALVTGGSRGIGKACVEIFSEAGADVAFTYNLAEDEAEKLEIGSGKKTTVKSFRVNLLNEQEIKQTSDKILKEFQNVDILVNNAGIWKESAVDEMTIDQWEETIKINLTGTFLFTKYFVPGMKKNNFGRIINISSTAGQRGEAFHSHYAASKGGIISFTKSLAAELGKFNITVNCVAPGWVFTDMTSDSLNNESVFEKVKSDIPLNKIAAPMEIAGPVLFLASDLASHITGEILNVNGGSVLCG